MFDAFVIGGGLAGLATAIKLREAGLSVGLSERQVYPFHRVCGEYVSNEALGYVRSLGVDPFALGAVNLNAFRFTAPDGAALDLPLDLGGFGVSRYALDHALYQTAERKGVRFFLGEQVAEVKKSAEGFSCLTAQGKRREAKLVIGAFGKRSTLDRALGRRFFSKRSPWVGVKRHVRLPAGLHPEPLIALHNFRNGYCGISRVEDSRYCLCYLVRREEVQRFGSIEKLEKESLSANPHLKDVFGSATFLYDKPKVINEVSFAYKPPVEGGLLMCGDSAGLIAPLCGNGMAMAFRASQLLSESVLAHREGRLSRQGMESAYAQAWRKEFALRLAAGRTLQRFFGSERLSSLLLATLSRAKPVARKVVRMTHGRPF